MDLLPTIVGFTPLLLLIVYRILQGVVGFLTVIVAFNLLAFAFVFLATTAGPVYALTKVMRTFKTILKGYLRSSGFTNFADEMADLLTNG